MVEKRTLILRGLWFGPWNRRSAEAAKASFLEIMIPMQKMRANGRFAYMIGRFNWYLECLIQTAHVYTVFLSCGVFVLDLSSPRALYSVGSKATV